MSPSITALINQQRRAWRLVFGPSLGKTKFYLPVEWKMRTSLLDKRTALKFLGIFDDAVYIEKVRGFRKGRKIDKRGER